MASAPDTGKKARPTAVEVARQNICTECGKPLPPRAEKARGPMRQYCPGPACKRARLNRRLVRGAAVIEWAQTWRRNRGQGELGQAALAQLCQVLDIYNAEDLAEGRPPADLAAARMLTSVNVKYIDRQRR